MAYRAQPQIIARHVNNLLKANLLKEPPVWLSAVQAYPPGPSIVRAKNPEVNVSGQTEIEQQLFSKPPPKQRIRYSSKHVRTRAPKPLPIIYPEDRLRRQFYRDHPFELSRPKVLVEDEHGINRTDFSKLLLDGMHPSQIDGEAVIKYQLYLMTHEKMSERKAYAKATSEFYEIRAKQEEMERELKRKLLEALGKQPKKKWTQKGLALEQKALERNEASALTMSMNMALSM